MPKVNITDEAMTAIRGASHGTFKQTAKRSPLGWELELDNDVYERLVDELQLGESISDTIIRAIAVLTGKGNN